MTFTIIHNEQTPAVPADAPRPSAQEITAFLAFFKKQETAAGLAANQCALDGVRWMHRMFAVRTNPELPFHLILHPVIDRTYGRSQVQQEGCLTWIGKSIYAQRYPTISVSHETRDREKITGRIISGFEAQIWQHEVNHLNGVIERFTFPHGQAVLKPQRNSQCACGSGKKYKQCCMLVFAEK